MKNKENKVITHNIEVSHSTADRIVNETRGVLIVQNNSHQYQTGDFIEFNVLEDGICGLHDSFHSLNDQMYIVNGVYSGTGIEPGYVVLLVDYYSAREESED